MSSNCFLSPAFCCRKTRAWLILSLNVCNELIWLRQASKVLDQYGVQAPLMNHFHQVHFQKAKESAFDSSNGCLKTNMKASASVTLMILHHWYFHRCVFYVSELVDDQRLYIELKEMGSLNNHRVRSFIFGIVCLEAKMYIHHSGL